MSGVAYEDPQNPDRLRDGPRREDAAYGEEDYEDGELMALPPEAAAKRALEIWSSQDEIRRLDLAQWKVNRWRRKGYSGVQVIKDPDTKQARAWAPPGATPDRNPHGGMKAAQLCNRMTAVLFADPPVPEPVPMSGEDEDVNAAEMSSRILQSLDDESHLDELNKWKKAFSRGCTYGSGWIHYFVDRYGGERKPIEVEAGYSDEEVPSTDQMGNPVLDEMGLPAMQQVRREAQDFDEAPFDPNTGEEWPEYRKRYVRPDGALTDEEGEAAQRWTRELRSEVLNSPNVRLIPHTAGDVWEAEGAQIGMFVPWGELKRMDPRLETLPKEMIDRLMGFRPDGSDELLVPGGRPRDLKIRKNPNENLVFTLITYYKKCAKYKRGLYLITVADVATITREPWVAQVGGKEEALDLPLTQFAQFDGGEEGPYKIGLMEYIGPGNEVRSAILGSFLDHLDRFGRRKMFVPTSSIVHPKQLQQPTFSVIPINPGGQPYYEEIPEYPKDGFAAFDVISQEMDHISGLEQTAQGVEDDSVRSGVHAATIVSQVHAGLSELRQNTEKAIVRSWRIKLQLARAYFDMERLLLHQADGKDYVVEHWRGSDLGSTRDVKIKVGSFTMLAPESKAVLAEKYASMGIISPEELRDIIAGNVGGSIGMQDDPVRIRIRRQISQWKKGPPPDWQGPQFEQVPMPDPMTGAPAVDPMSGAMLTQEVPVPDPLWEPVPSDELPLIAQVRLYELARFMQTKAYLEQPPEWRLGMEMEFQRMGQAAAPPMPMLPGPGGPPSGSQSKPPGAPPGMGQSPRMPAEPANPLLAGPSGGAL
jgi:hypothetical protein